MDVVLAVVLAVVLTVVLLAVIIIAAIIAAIIVVAVLIVCGDLKYIIVLLNVLLVKIIFVVSLTSKKS